MEKLIEKIKNSRKLKKTIYRDRPIKCFFIY